MSTNVFKLDWLGPESHILKASLRLAALQFPGMQGALGELQYNLALFMTSFSSWNLSVARSLKFAVNAQ